MRIGYKLIAEVFSPTEIVRQAVSAERVGFDFVEVSDHFHPWLSDHQHSGFAWSMLAAIAARTERIELATGVTCPFLRYHPAIIAQAAATTALLSDGRFTLGVGAGERLNEHVVGRGWPPADVRQEMLRESLEMIRLLWTGGYHSFRGQHLCLEDARVFDLPDTPPRIAVAAGGPAAAKIAGELGDALFVTEPRADLVRAYHDAGFDAATSYISPADVREVFGCGPDPQRLVAVAAQFAEAGYDNLALINAGPDVDGFFDFFADELAPKLRELSPA